MTFAISTLKQPSFITKRDTKKTILYASLINFHGLTAPIFWQSDRKELSLPSDFRFQFKRRDGLTRERERRGDEAFRACVRFLGKVKKRHGRSGEDRDSAILAIDWLSPYLHHGHCAYFIIEQAQYLVYLVQPKSLFTLFQFTDKTKSYSRFFREFDLRQVILLTHCLYKLG